MTIVYRCYSEACLKQPPVGQLYWLRGGCITEVDSNAVVLGYYHLELGKLAVLEKWLP